MKAIPLLRCCLLSALMSEDLPTLGIPITMAQYSRLCPGTRAGSQGSTQSPAHSPLRPVLGAPQAEVCVQGKDGHCGDLAHLNRAAPPFLLREQEDAGQLHGLGQQPPARHLQQQRAPRSSGVQSWPSMGTA